MEYNLIPKSLTKEKLIIVKNFTFIDLFLTIIYATFAILMAVGLTFCPVVYRVIIGLTIFFALLLTLVTNKKYHLKTYQIIIAAFKYFAQKKQYQNTSKTNHPSLLIPYEKVVNNFLVTSPLEGNHRWYLGALEIKGFNISALSSDEQYLKIRKLQEVFKYVDCHMTLLKIDQPLNMTNNENYLYQQFKHLKNLKKTNKITSNGYDSRLKQIKGYLAAYEQQDESQSMAATSKHFYLFIYHKKYQELVKMINLAETKINNSSCQAISFDYRQVINTIKAIFNPYEQPFSQQVIDGNLTNLKTLLSFSDIKFASDHFIINKVYYAVNAVHDYPIFPRRNGWGANIANDGATMLWNISPTNRDIVKDQIHKAITNATTNVLAVKKVMDKSEQYYQMNAFHDLVATLTNGEESIKKCNILFLNYGHDLKSLKVNQNNLTQTLKENNMTIDYLLYRQYQGFSSILPKPTDPLSLTFAREMPTWTLASAFPFINNNLDDKKGLFMGFNTTGDIIVYDQFVEDYHRKNFNQLLLGTSGSGKSHTAKKQLNWHISNGRKVIVIDPEREYKNLCHYHDGNWIDVGNASAGKINPLQILSSLDENDSNSIVIANYLQTLEHWFSIIIPDLTANELRYLMQQVNNLYESKGLLTNNNLITLPVTAFPIFSDLLTFMQNNPTSQPEHFKIMNIIALEFTGNGKYSQLYNYHSTLQLNTNLLTVFDIFSLFEKGNNKAIQAQLFLILAYIQHEVKINSFTETNEIVILVDEAHLIIDKDNPVGLNFMYQMVKRIRKRRGGIILVTQNPDDFVGNVEIIKKTTAMLNNTQYMMILNVSMQNLKDVQELFKSYGGLSNQEQEFIAKAKRGQTLFVVSGFNRHCLQIELSSLELEAFNGQFPSRKTTRHVLNVLKINNENKKTKVGA